jgi:hypothetical protein
MDDKLRKARRAAKPYPNPCPGAATHRSADAVLEAPLEQGVIDLGQFLGYGWRLTAALCE